MAIAIRSTSQISYPILPAGAFTAIKRYIFFHGKRHPADMGAPEVTAFLTSLAVVRATRPQHLPVVLTRDEMSTRQSGTPRPLAASTRQR